MINVITGVAGSGKTVRAAQFTLERLEASGKVVVLLPTQPLIEDFRTRLLKNDAFSGSLNLQFHTFYSLVQQVLIQAQIPVHEMDVGAASLVLEDLLRQQSEKYPTLTQHKITSGFVRNILNYFSDLANGAIDTTTAVKVAESKDISQRVRELHRVYRDFTNKLRKKNRYTREQLFITAANWLRENPKRFAGNTLVIDGFYDYNPVQRVLVEQLVTRANSGLITLLDNESPVFDYIAETKTWVRELVHKVGGDVHSLPHSERQIPGLAQLFSQHASPEDAHNVQFVEASAAYLEIQETVRSIKRDILTEKYSPADLCVIYRSGDDYYAGVTDACRREGIPISDSHEQLVMTNPAISTLMQWYEVLLNDFPREDVIHWLNSGYINPKGLASETAIALVDDLSISASITSGKEEWITELTQYKKGRKSNDESPGNTASVRRIISAIQTLWGRLPSEKTASLREHLSDLQQVMDCVDFRASIQNSDSGESDSNGRDLRALEKFDDLLNRLINLDSTFQLGEFSTGEFIRRFRGLLRETKYTAETGISTGVTLTNVEHARGLFWKKVYVVGLLDEVFPIRHRTHPLVKIGDRTFLNRKLPSSCKVVEHRADLPEERLLFYLAMTRASEAVQVSTVSGAEDILPSPFYEELHRLYVENPTRENPENLKIVRADSLENLNSEDSWLTLDLMQHLRHYDTVHTVSVINTEQFFHARDVQRMRDGTKCTIYDGHISAPDLKSVIRDSLIGENVSLSPSRLETYYESPFQYFARYILNLKEPEEVADELPPDLRGLLLHTIMERFYPALPKEYERKVTEANLDSALKHLESVLTGVFNETEADGLPWPDLLWEKEKQTITRYCENAVEFFATHHPWNSPNMVPDNFEFSFGFDEEDSFPALELHSGETTLRLRGRADRLDINVENGQFTVVDYKTSHGKAAKDFWNGKALQLPVYGMAAQHLADQYTAPIRLSYYSFKKGKEDKKLIFGKKLAPENLYEATRENIWQAITKMQQGIFHPVAGECSKYCPVKHICRCEENRIRRKSSG